MPLLSLPLFPLPSFFLSVLFSFFLISLFLPYFFPSLFFLKPAAGPFHLLKPFLLILGDNTIWVACRVICKYAPAPPFRGGLGEGGFGSVLTPYQPLWVTVLALWPSLASRVHPRSPRHLLEWATRPFLK